MTPPAIDFLNVPEDMLDQPVEAWVPKVGDRVRVTGGIAECRAVQQDYSNESLKPLASATTGHWASEAGRTGTIVPLDPSLSPIDAHRFVVKYDLPITLGGGEACFTCTYTAAELEPLS